MTSQESKSALLWATAALQGLVNGTLSDRSTFTVEGETKTIAQILDMADAALEQPQQPATPPAPAEPQAEVAAWMTHHDEPMLFPTREEAACFCDDDEPPIPLYTAPQQPAQGQDPKDAARYRWLRTYPNNFNATVYGPGGGILRRDTYLDAAIDAAMTAQDAAQGGGKNG